MTTLKKQKNKDMAGKMSAVEFSCAAANLRLAPDAFATARRVLVDGESQAVVCRETGLSKQLANYWVTRVSDAYTKQQTAMFKAAPEGWAAAILALPVDQMEKAKAQMLLALATRHVQEANDGKGE